MATMLLVITHFAFVVPAYAALLWVLNRSAG